MADITKLESFKLITLEEFKNWEGFDKLVAQYGKKLYDNNISNYLIEGITRASLQLDSICGYRLETEFPLLDPNSEIDKKRINYVKIACCLQTQYLIRTGIEYSTGGENSSDKVTSYTYPTNMKIEFSPDVISLLEKAKFYKSQTITKINPDNYGFKNEYHTWFGRPDTNYKDRPIMLSEADAKYVWKNSIFKSNTFSIIPWVDTEKSGTWQIEISQELLTKYIDNYIKNFSIKVDNKSVVYNSNNELSVPFDNNTIYYENNVWKAKQGSSVETPIDNKTIIKNEQQQLMVSDVKQDKLVSGTNIKTINGNSLLGSGDISISSGNNWEVINTSDFIKNSKEYTVRAFDNKYYYRINCSVETQFRIYGFTIFVNPKFISEKIPRTHYIGTSIEGYSSIFEWDKNTNYGTVTIEKAESAQYLNGIYIERKKINN
ncbi:hypothetical protein [Spiroplasma endosymbiont of Seladonia tumulorum]|uniref:hypothetical protein n=1 Tax=Spiroplasma endosymbiont of Seladonia tumulorum TaxID=3066321 RepID=UPI0030CD0F71